MTSDASMERDTLEMLLNAVRMSDAPKATGPEAEEYDWSRPNRFADREKGKLRRFAEKMAGRASQSLEDTLDRNVPLELMTISQLYDDDMRNEVDASKDALVPITVEDEEAGLLIIPRQLAFEWIGVLLGGITASDHAERRFTGVESAVLLDTVKAVMKALSEVSQELGGPALAYREHVYLMDYSLPLDETAEHCKMEMGASADADQPSLTVVLLNRVLDGITGKARKQAKSSSKRNMRERIIGHLNEMPVTADAFVGSADVRMVDLMHLTDGDVLLMRMKPGDPIELRVQGTPVMTGFPVRNKGKFAFQMKDHLDPSVEDDHDAGEDAGDEPADPEQPGEDR